jgi:3'(2'), 5'-bisphosphate nucleotidase
MKAQRPQVQPLLDSIMEAGALARTMQSRISLSVKPDGTVVTETDISSHNMLCKALAKLTPDIPVISEEQSSAENEQIMKSASLFWAIDPLDVTANYAAGGNAYSINVALVEDGVPVMGVLYFPGMEELYYTGDDGKAFKQLGKETPRAIHVAPLHDGTKTAAVRPNTQATHVAGNESTLKVIFTRGQRRACLVATGEATFCSERGGFRIWDSAATYAIITAAGGAIEQHNGEPVRYNTTIELPSYFVGHPELLRHLHAVQPEQPLSEIPAPFLRRSENKHDSLPGD